LLKKTNSKTFRKFTAVIEDKDTLNYFSSLIHFPLGELDAGMYGNTFNQVSINSILIDAISQAANQSGFFKKLYQINEVK